MLDLGTNPSAHNQCTAYSSAVHTKALQACMHTHHVGAASIRVCQHFCVAVAGGLTVNDFVMASKINTLDFSDLQNKKKARTFFI